MGAHKELRMLTDMKENMEAEYKLLRLAAKDETKSQAERDAAKDEIRRVAAAMVQVRQDKGDRPEKCVLRIRF